jgi:acyl-CoA thioesterase-1
MRFTLWSILPVLALGACGGDAPAPAPTESAAATAPAASAEVSGPERRILAFGDSLFAGYGLGEDEGYPEKLEAALRARGINAVVTDAGVSGDTTAAGRQRIGFVLDTLEEKPDLALVELGGNDLLRGLSPAEARSNLAAILGELRERGIPAVLFGMRAPPNAGPEYQAEFDAMYPALAEEYGVRLVPFFLEAVYDKPELIQQDRVHPTADGIDAMVAATVDDVVEALPEVEEQ